MRGGFIFARITPRAAPVEEEATTTSGWVPRIGRLLRRPSRETRRVEGHALVDDAVLRPITTDELKAASDWLNDPLGLWRPRR